MIAEKIERRTTLDDHEIIIHTHNIRESDAIFAKLNMDKPIEVIIRNKRKKRSLDANAFCWVLCDEIAKKINSTKEDVYRQHVHDVGVFDFIAIPTKAVPQFTKSWHAKGEGWLTEIFNSCTIPNCTKICCYYGSSTYDSKQMARLIDSLVEEAEALGIPTKTKPELMEMYKEWGEAYDR